MSSWKARLLMMLTALAMLATISAAPALADHDDDCEFFPGHGWVCEDDDDDGFHTFGLDNGDEEDVDVDIERFGDIWCIFIWEEEDDGDEELEDWACFDEDGRLLWVED